MHLRLKTIIDVVNILNHNKILGFLTLNIIYSVFHVKDQARTCSSPRGKKEIPFN